MRHRSKVGCKGKGSIFRSFLERMEPAKSVNIRVDAEQAKESARKYASIAGEVNCSDGPPIGALELEADLWSMAGAGEKCSLIQLSSWLICRLGVVPGWDNQDIKFDSD